MHFFDQRKDEFEIRGGGGKGGQNFQFFSNFATHNIIAAIDGEA